jgi:hypothetical protein
MRRQIKGLVLLSAACEKAGMHPAQGIRIANRKFPTAFKQLKASPSTARTNALVGQILKSISKRQLPRVRTTPLQAPEHFLLETTITSPLKKTRGY